MGAHYHRGPATPLARRSVSRILIDRKRDSRRMFRAAASAATRERTRVSLRAGLHEIRAGCVIRLTVDRWTDRQNGSWDEV